MQAEKYKINHIQPTWSDNEKEDLESKIALLQEENQQLQCFKKYFDKIVLAKRFCTLKLINEEECLWIQFKHERDFKVCAYYGISGHSKSWCQAPRQSTFAQGNTHSLHFFVQNSQKRVENKYTQSDCDFHLSSKHKSS